MVGLAVLVQVTAGRIRLAVVPEIREAQAREAGEREPLELEACLF
jgi:hypothetical protein